MKKKSIFLKNRKKKIASPENVGLRSAELDSLVVNWALESVEELCRAQRAPALEFYPGRSQNDTQRITVKSAFLSRT